MNRRTFLGLAGATAAAGLLPAATAGGRRPNILFIPLDDLKPLLGCYGVKEILSPNIDKLAAGGTVFLNNHCQQAVCGPTRASLMTGLFPDRTGVWDLETRMRDVNPNVLSLPQHLAAHGYVTTGLGKTYDSRCVDKKLDEPSWTLPYGSKPITFHAQTGAPKGGYHAAEVKEALAKGLEGLKGQTFKSGSAKNAALAKLAGPRAAPATECLVVPDDAYFDGAMTTTALAWLKELSAQDKPFFLSVGYAKPHLPFIAPKKYWDLYQRENIQIAPFQQHAANSPELAYHTSGELRSYSDIPDVGEITPDIQKELIHGYHACVSYVDAQIGRLLDELEKLGLADNTIVCLWGDHGWHLGDHGLWNKHSNFEQATRAPLIIRAPGGQPKRNTAEPSGFVDIFPTLCELSGIPIPAALEGVSLAGLIKGREQGPREFILSQYPRSIDGKPVMGYTLRDRRHRYVKWVQMDYRKGERKGLLVATELYDYEKDPLETRSEHGNPAYADVVKRFEAHLAAIGVAQTTGPYSKAAQGDPAVGFGAPLYNGEGKFLSAGTVAVSGQPFHFATEVKVAAKPESVSGAAYKRPNTLALKAGTAYRVTCSARALSEGAQFNAIFQLVKPGIKKVAELMVKPGKEWKNYTFEFTPDADIAAGDAVLTCHCGYALQSFQVGGVKLETR